MLRSVADRHRMALETLAGLECQDRAAVPAKRMMRRAVMIWNGPTANVSQIGETKRILMNNVVIAGAVDAVVGVVPVERALTTKVNGERRRLHLAVKSVIVSII